MSIGFGLLSAQRSPGDPRSWEDVYRETIALSVDLESFGYGSVWTSEHHFVDDGYMPSLLVTSAAIAAATSTIGIATGVVLAPLHHPLRLAEDAATVQVISDGRLVLGLGLGWSDVEYGALGVDKTQRGRALSEILQNLPVAWRGEPFTWQGSVYEYDTLAIRPVPTQKIPIVVGGGVDAAVRRAARYADGFFSNASPERLSQQIAVANEEMERIGRDPESFRWIYYAVMYPGPVEQIIDSVWQQVWKYSDMEASATRSGIATVPSMDEATRTSMTKQIIGGSSQEIVDALNTIRADAGVPIEWVARSHFSDLGYDRQRDLAEQIAVEVVPFLPTA